jgi:A/G-specific adenine glycosylase
MKTEISAQLLDWYDHHSRVLPWRDVTDPYAIWVAEVMLQQTRVDTVIPYYQRWLQRFPTIRALADADQQQVLSLWEGLGYYSRARNLHKAARLVMDRHNGRIPADPAELGSLPGIGKAGAADILSIAFGQDIAAVDGNIRRVIARLFKIELELGSPAFEVQIQSLVDDHLPPGRAGDYNQAWMDLGATICLPEHPHCVECPLRQFCLGLQAGQADELPIRKAKAAVPVYTVTAGILRRQTDGKTEVLITRRPEDGLLGGMWEFPGGKCEPGETLPDCLRRELREELDIEVRVMDRLGTYRHAYTHFKVVLTAFFVELDSGQPRPLASSELAWASLEKLAGYPMGKIDRMISRDLNNPTQS